MAVAGMAVAGAAVAGAAPPERGRVGGLLLLARLAREGTRVGMRGAQGVVVKPEPPLRRGVVGPVKPKPPLLAPNASKWGESGMQGWSGFHGRTESGPGAPCRGGPGFMGGVRAGLGRRAGVVRVSRGCLRPTHGAILVP